MPRDASPGARPRGADGRPRATGGRPRGRPRDPAVERAIVDAALVLLAETGWRSLSIDRIAERAGVAATTVYRRYASVEEVLLDIMRRTYAAVRVPDTGNVRDDLLALVGDLVAVWSSPAESRRSFLAAVVAAMDEQPVLAAAYAEMRDRRRAETVAVIERAIARGEVRPDADANLVLDTLSGAVDHRVLFWRMPLSPDLATRLVDLVLPGILTATAAPGPSAPGPSAPGPRAAGPRRSQVPAPPVEDGLEPGDPV